MTDPYENLANAIIVQAADDYRKSLKTLKQLRELDTKKMTAKAKEKYATRLYRAEQDFKEVRSFFYSDWYAVLTSVNPEFILSKLDKECEDL